MDIHNQRVFRRNVQECEMFFHILWFFYKPNLALFQNLLEVESSLMDFQKKAFVWNSICTIDHFKTKRDFTTCMAIKFFLLHIKKIRWDLEATFQSLCVLNGSKSVLRPDRGFLFKSFCFTKGFCFLLLPCLKPIHRLSWSLLQMFLKNFSQTKQTIFHLRN